MAKKKRGRPRRKDLEICPKCKKPGWPIIRRLKRKSAVYLQKYFMHYVPDAYKAHGINTKMMRNCYIGSAGKEAA